MHDLKSLLSEIAALPDAQGVSIATVNDKTRYGDTPLHIVAGWGDCEAIQMLIEAGASINAIGEAGFTPLHSAAQHGHVKAVELLVQQGADMSINNDDGDTAFELAVLLEEEEVVHSFITTTDFFISDFCMSQAISLARKGLNITTPNPSVGCVIVKDGQVIGEGFTAPVGGNHAEINALESVTKNGFSPVGASVYVTLEPCSHYGRTPPCADALIAAGVAEVIIGSRDPNPQVSGRGVQKLREAGIAVTEDVLREECDKLYTGFFKRITTGMPWVTVKLGMSLDAKIATASGESQWITGEAARADVQQLRAMSCAVMTSSATVITDNPSLNVRLAGATRQPKRVVVDSQLAVSPQSKIFQLAGDVLLYSVMDLAPTVQHAKATYRQVPRKQRHADLHAVLHDLGTVQQCNHVLVEAGGRFVAALLAENLVDELVVYQAPMLLGEGAKPAFAFPAMAHLNQALSFSVCQYRQIGQDIKLTLKPCTL